MGDNLSPRRCNDERTSGQNLRDFDGTPPDSPGIPVDRERNLHGSGSLHNGRRESMIISVILSPREIREAMDVSQNTYPVRVRIDTEISNISFSRMYSKSPDDVGVNR